MSSTQQNGKASFFSLPAEIRIQIYAACVYDRDDYYSGLGLQWYDSTKLVPWTSASFFIADLATRGYDCGMRDMASMLEYRETPDTELRTLPSYSTRCNVLYLCRQTYREAIGLFYELNQFQFWNALLLRDFSFATFETGNLNFVADLFILIDLWDKADRRMDTAWEDWQALLEGEINGHGLNWHFPALQTLLIEFEPSYRMRMPYPVEHVDGRYIGPNLYRRSINQRPRNRQKGFDSFVDTLATTVRAPQVRVFGLHDRGISRALEKEMMGLGDGSGTWIPEDTYDPAFPGTEDWF